jgi:hypothetical protein
LRHRLGSPIDNSHSKEKRLRITEFQVTSR